MTNEFLPIVRGLDWGFHRRPKHATQQQKSANQKRVRCLNAQYPLQQFDLTWAYIKDDENEVVRDDMRTDFEAMLGFFNARHGNFESFLFRLADVTGKDSDSHVDGQLLGTGDGATKNFQLVRDYGSCQEIIQAFANLVVRVNGVVVPPVPVNYAVTDRGVVSFVLAPANGARIEADFDFFYRVTFEEDEIDFEDFMDRLYQLQSITLIEDRL